MEAEEYFSKDFEWEDLKSEIENDPSFQYHLLPFDPSSSSAIRPPEEESNAWRKFHSRHYTGKFFKERRYLLKEFPELVSCGKGSRVLEVGCGNGSTALPILRPCRKTSLGQSFPSDIKEAGRTLTGVPSKETSCCLGGLDFVTLIFTLSAIPLHMMPSALMKCFSVLKPGGFLLFRDYGLFDMTMLRFELDKRVGFCEYMRSDGTRSYFFSLETVRDLFVRAGFIEVELDYCCIKSLNRKKGKSMRRVWVHGKFQKPPL
ncbi:tRNA N(3)-methylcytidine methyltransferase METTL6 isoform X2 [Punica granatum]|uniref:tRNA N(3)-methylcytidine methyltransferase n=1 Tax=Punica granatum TaxID=22663 RepID=A0A6P8CH08_PUNGR|nr:tRNA N(3)-methylcytidine methyltransferase METTL6 isoform X2 [Punica granatum]